MMIDQTVISLVSACTALIASVAGPVATLRVARQQFRVSVLSLNRQRWIDAMRQNVSLAASQLLAAALVRDATPIRDRLEFARDPAVLKRIEDLMLTIAQIDLLLRPNDSEQAELKDLLDRALMMLKDPPDNLTLETEITGLVTLVLRQAKIVIRSQWLLVKTGR